MNLELCRKETSNGGEHRTKHNTGKQCKYNAHGNGKTGKVKDVTEDATGIDALVHDDG